MCASGHDGLAQYQLWPIQLIDKAQQHISQI